MVFDFNKNRDLFSCPNGFNRLLIDLFVALRRRQEYFTFTTEPSHGSGRKPDRAEGKPRDAGRSFHLRPERKSVSE